MMFLSYSFIVYFYLYLKHIWFTTQQTTARVARKKKPSSGDGVLCKWCYHEEVVKFTLISTKQNIASDHIDGCVGFGWPCTISTRRAASMENQRAASLGFFETLLQATFFGFIDSHFLISLLALDESYMHST